MSRATNEGELRHPDGSIDIAAYARIAHRERAAAIVAAARKTIRIVCEIFSAIRTRLTPVGRSAPASGKHRAKAGR